MKYACLSMSHTVGEEHAGKVQGKLKCLMFHAQMLTFPTACTSTPRPLSIKIFMCTRSFWRAKIQRSGS
jgi:hypothetical protein